MLRPNHGPFGLAVGLLLLAWGAHNGDSQGFANSSAPDMSVYSTINITLAGRSGAQQQAAAASCSQYNETYAQIDRDLALWAATGISQADMVRTIFFNTTTSGVKGIALGFEGGRAYVVEDPGGKRGMRAQGHHAHLFHTYMRVMVDLERRFGRALPDVEFVVQTGDTPLDLMSRQNGRFNPIMRFCKSASHADILIPNFHFNTKSYDEVSLGSVPRTMARYPWSERTPKAFTRNSLYNRHMLSGDSALQRKGFQGTPICKNNTTDQAPCRVRKHFQEWSKLHLDVLDVDHGKRPMEEFAAFKYLIHLDGQGLSSKMEQVLTMGSAVMREESGYIGHYYHLLKPYKHYLPFWKEFPEEILDVIKWAQDHDDLAREVGRAGQAFALRYLNAEARSCYWLTLLTRFAKLLRYTPGRANRNYTFYQPVEVYLNTVGRLTEQNLKINFQP